MMWARAKSVVETLLVRAGAARLVPRLLPRPALVLAYHNIVPSDAEVGGDIPLHLPQARFAQELDLLTETHDVVPLDRLLEGNGQRNGRRPRAAITFDDAYRGAVTAGVQELARRGLPVTIFVAPAFVGRSSFWWDALARDGHVPAEVRRRALEELRGRDDLIRRWARDVGWTLQRPGPWAAPATEKELRSALRHRGITLGSHTWSHPNLTRLAPEEVESELATSLSWLRERFECVLPWLAYPYGLHTPDVGRVVARTGYRAALCVDGGGWRRLPADRYALPRLNVPAGLSPQGFVLRIAGLRGRR